MALGSGHLDVLVFVEDPGAASYVIGLPAALRAAGYAVRVLAAGDARATLRAGAVAFEELPAATAAAGALAQCRPRLVVAGTAENEATPGLALLDAARAAGIASLGIVDGPASAAWRFRGAGDDPLAHAPDFIVVPDDATAARYAGLGHRADRVVACGHPAIERARERREALDAREWSARRRALCPAAPDGRPILLFAAERSSGLGHAARFRRGPDYTLRGEGTSEDRTDIVLDELLGAVEAMGERPALVLRPHPKESRDDYRRYLDRFDACAEGGDGLAAAAAADLVVGLTSIYLFEAAALGRPTLSIVPRETEKAWLSSIGLGLTACVWTRRDLRAWLRGFARDDWRCEVPDVAGLVPIGATARLAALVAGLLEDTASPAAGAAALAR